MSNIYVRQSELTGIVVSYFFIIAIKTASLQALKINDVYSYEM